MDFRSRRNRFVAELSTEEKHTWRITARILA